MSHKGKGSTTSTANLARDPGLRMQAKCSFFPANTSPRTQPHTREQDAWSQCLEMASTPNRITKNVCHFYFISIASGRMLQGRDHLYVYFYNLSTQTPNLPSSQRDGQPQAPTWACSSMEPESCSSVLFAFSLSYPHLSLMAWDTVVPLKNIK